MGAGSGLGVVPAAWLVAPTAGRPLPFPLLLGLPPAGQALGPLWVQMVVTDNNRRRPWKVAVGWGPAHPCRWPAASAGFHPQTQVPQHHKHGEAGGATPTLGKVFYPHTQRHPDPADGGQ